MWGDGTDTTSVPHVRPYDESDVLALLGKVVPYDWAGFFAARIDRVAPRAPLEGITNGGYALVYTDTPSSLQSQSDENDHVYDALFSFGATMSSGATSEEDGTIKQIRTGSPAFAAGLAPGTRILAVDGRKWSEDRFRDALAAHKGGREPLHLIVSNEDRFESVDVPVFTGERYPHLVRVASQPDELAKIYAPKTFVPAAASRTLSGE